MRFAQTGTIHAAGEGARTMPSKTRKPKPFRATSAVKAAARAAIGSPPPTRAEPGSKKRKVKTEKHKPTLSKLLEDSGD